MNKAWTIVLLPAALLLAVAGPATAQYGAFGKEQILKYTALYKGERFPDGRPRVSDAALRKLRGATLEDIMGPLRRIGQSTVENAGRWKHGYTNQIELGWKIVHPGRPLVGRALTASFMPARGDINDVIERDGRAAGYTEPQNTWPIRQLVTGDVMVVDLFGKIEKGTFAGDGLSTTIASQVGKDGGLIVDGAVRDLDGIFPIPDFNVYVRDYHHSAIGDVMLMGINVPVQIGNATCMPGDLVVGSREGVVFIPAHIAEEVADAVETATLRTTWMKQRIREGKYTYTETHTHDGPIQADFDQWLKEYREKYP